MNRQPEDFTMKAAIIRLMDECFKHCAGGEAVMELYRLANLCDAGQVMRIWE